MLKRFESFVPRLGDLRAREAKKTELWYRDFVEESGDKERAQELIKNFKFCLEMLRNLESVRADGGHDPYGAFVWANHNCKYGYKWQDMHTGIWHVAAFSDIKDAQEYGRLYKIAKDGNEHDWEYLSYFCDGRKDYEDEELTPYERQAMTYKDKWLYIN